MNVASTGLASRFASMTHTAWPVNSVRRRRKVEVTESVFPDAEETRTVHSDRCARIGSARTVATSTTIAHRTRPASTAPARTPA